MHSDRHLAARKWLSAIGGMLVLGLVGYWLGGPRFSDAQPNAAAESPAPVVRGYRVPQEHLDAALEDLRQAFPPEKNARFAVDTRSRQILAVAPSDLQPQVEAQLTDYLKNVTAKSAEPAPNDAGAAGHRDGATATRSTRRPLRHASPEDFELALQNIWGRRVHVARAEGGQSVTMTIPGVDGPSVLQFDAQRKLVQLVGSPASHAALEKLVDALDQPRDAAPPVFQLVSQERARDPQFRSSLAVLRAALDADARAEAAPAADPEAVAQAADAPAPKDAPAGPAGEEGDDDEAGLIGQVQIEIVNEFGLIIVKGKKRDVERVMKIIEQLETKKTPLTIQVYALKNANNESLATLVNQVYSQFLASRQGSVGIYPLVKPNALLLVGQPESLETVIELIQKLDRPVAPSAHWKVFPLQFLSASEAAQTVTSFYNPRAAGGAGGQQQAGGQQFQQQPGLQGVPGLQGQQGFPVAPQPAPAGGAAATGLGTRLEVVAEVRSNSLLVRGSPRDLADVAALLKKLDVDSVVAQSDVRVFKVTNTMARDLATVLNAAIRGQSLTTGGAAQGGQGAAPGFQQPQQPGGGAGGAAGGTTRGSTLNFIAVDKKTGETTQTTAVANDVVVTADNNSNALIVRAPKKTMALVEAIINELDSLPDASAQIKVFTINASDATYLAQMLQQLFGQQVTIGRGTGGFLGAGNVANQLATAGLNTGDSSLVPLRFAVDARTNSIIASGSAGDLKVVEALLIRLDEDDVQTRRIAVYRLKNAFAQDVTSAITTFLTQQRQVVQQNLAFNVAIDPFEQLEREVAISAEPVSNSVIISATPQFFDRVMEIIEKLDYRPPMVMVQVLIAEVRLSDVYEFGVELGLQDSLLFDRGKASLAGANPQSVPGFGFGAAGLPNANSVGQSNVAGQALSALGVGRSNTTLGYGGMVLSAASDSVNVLIRALQDTGRLQILSRPQVMAIHNRQARVLVGQKVPRITGTTFNTLGNPQNQVSDVDVGLILNIIPQINNDNVVILNVQAERSRVSDTEGVTIGVTAQGQPITSPRIDNTSAVTTISARDGQTVAFAGLMTSEKTNITRGVPYLSNLPLLGNLFKYEFDSEIRKELLIVMTPRIIKHDEDYEWLNAVESERMSWCLADVVNLHGDVGLRGNNNLFCCDNVPVIYPDLDPTGSQYRKPVNGPNPDDKLHGENRPTGRRPITGQPGGRPQPVSGSDYMLPAPETPYPAPSPSANVAPRSGVQPANWNQSPPPVQAAPPPPPYVAPAGGAWQPKPTARPAPPPIVVPDNANSPPPSGP